MIALVIHERENEREIFNSLPGNVADQHPVTVLVLVSRHILRPIHGIHQPPLIRIVTCNLSFARLPKH